MNVLITGHSRGLGSALTDLHLSQGDHVFGVSRTKRPGDEARLTQIVADFNDPAAAAAALAAHLAADIALERVFLNAGVLGPIAALGETPLATIREVMEINVWANKAVLDWLLARPTTPVQVVLMSSGASVSGNFGWGAYALSKATLNMLTRLYAHEFPASHLCALAPGLVETSMQDEIAAQDAEAFPSLARLQAARGTANMPTPAIAAQRIVDALPRLREFPSGSFVDMREANPDHP
ncbi:MAG: SDR family NAD(P)-dependent oxidoreductase [Gammaproteobacteria bacterium]